ncbi:MAG: RHS domain-containing protein [Acidobacteria bacterium]|nr:RHS domain-containing protein [Acidobacteriota bacterium]
MTDHLGTPRIQTDSTGAIVWHAEHEPYGRIYLLREGDGRHQPLRFPGQKAEQLGVDAANGITDRNYNIFRWYRAAEGRYTEADPLGVALAGPNLYGYVDGNPLTLIDPAGLLKVKQTITKRGPQLGGGQYSLSFSKVNTDASCSGCDGEGWSFELSLNYDHGYLCTTFISCTIEKHHANIATAFVSKAAMTFKKHEAQVYSSKAACQKAAKSYAQELKWFMKNPGAWPEKIQEGFWKAQQDYEETHHGNGCDLWPWWCGAM